MPPRPHRTLLVIGLLAAGACRTTSDEPPVAPFAVELEHFVGSVRTGPLAVGGTADAEPWIAELQVARVSAAPPGAGSPLSAGARHVFLEHADETLGTRSELALGALNLAPGPLLEQVVWSRQRRAALFPGTAASWHTVLEPGADSPLDAAWESVDVQVSRDGESAEVALVFEGPVAPRREDDEGVVRFGEPLRRREHVVSSAACELDGEPLRVFLPAVSPGAPGGGLLIELRLSTAGLHAAAESVAAALEDLDRSRARAREQASGLSASESFQFESEAALRALEHSNLQRPALAFLAQQTGAQLAGELALSAEEDVLEEFLGAVRGRLGPDLRIDEPLALGWFLDETAYLWIAAIAEDPERELPAGLAALLLAHTGELGRYPDLVKEVVAETGGLAALDRRLVEENRIFLEDGHPAARVRAFDWLAARGAAPAEYDPLASLAQRRQALAAAAEGGQ